MKKLSELSKNERNEYQQKLLDEYLYLGEIATSDHKDNPGLTKEQNLRLIQINTTIKNIDSLNRIDTATDFHNSNKYPGKITNISFDGISGALNKALSKSYGFKLNKSELDICHKKVKDNLKRKGISLSIIAFFFSLFSIGQNGDNRIERLIADVTNYDQFEILLPYLTNCDSIPSIFPLKNYKTYNISSEFGSRFHPIEKIKKFHKGIDLATEIGTFVIATADGKVESIKFSNSGHGRNITINHNYGFVTKYSHLSIILVPEKSSIKKGDIIGMVGSTGGSTGNHLHYEIIKNGRNLNPKKFFYIY